MVVNSTLPYFILEGYLHLGTLRYLFFVLTAVTYISIVASNVLLVAVICVNRSLHEPMYLFLCSLFVNELYGSTGLFPFLMLHVLSDSHSISAPFCFLQIHCIYTYANVEFCNLAVMSYDRYVAICCPLQYNTRMSSNNVFIVIVFVWIYPVVKCLINVCLSVRLTLCGNRLNSLVCHNYLVVKLACSDTTVNNIYGLFGTVLTVLVPVLLILFSYMKILRVCFSGSRQTRQRAVSTCSPQLVSLLNFSFGCSFTVLQSRFDVSSVPTVLRRFLTLYHYIILPLLNPLMFGMQMSKLRNAWKRVLCCETSAGRSDAL